MSYDKKSIFEVLEDIRSNKAYLPAIQRRFVWPRGKIEKLFDSIMRGYPIGSFLFWQIKGERAREYVFYEFLKNYDERSPYNQRYTGTFTNQNEIIGVLDGQQRLSSIYIGLQGTHKEKRKNSRRSSDHAYPETRLYLNLLSLPIKNVDSRLAIERDQDYEFRFLTEQHAKQPTRVLNEVPEFCFWFKISSALEWDKDHDFDSEFESLRESIENEERKNAFNLKRKEIRKTLSDLHRRLHEDLINYYNVKSNDLEDILEIFVRVNGQGMVLSKSDLLFSTIVATWSDGRAEIEEFLKEINVKGEGFNFHNDFLMRCCLVLTDLNVLFKVNSFKAENVEAIKSSWECIKQAIRKSIDLLVEWGLSKETLTSQNAVIIIAYHFMKGGDGSYESVHGLRKYLLYSLMQNVYGGQGDQVIGAFRNTLRRTMDDGKYELVSKVFPFESIRMTKLPANKTIDINSKDVENYLEYKKGAQSFFVLSLLYPNLRYSEIFFHQDHIHPASRFNLENYIINSVSEEEREKWNLIKDCVPNLQLMEGHLNSSKNATPFAEWLNGNSKEGISNVTDKVKFLQENYIDESVDLSFSNFEKFYENRKVKLRTALLAKLNINSEIALVNNASNLDYVDNEEVDDLN